MSKAKGRRSVERALNSEQQERAELIFQHLKSNGEAHLRELAVLLASKEDHEIFGEAEFQARDILLQLGAEAMQANVDARSKKGVPGC